MTRVRLAKFIADSGVASRRGAEDLITSGVVSVNGDIVTTPVFFVDNGDTVTVRGRRVVPQDDTRLYVFHKPINVMTTAHDPSGRRTIYDVLPREYKNLKYVGRLDYKTTGLLLLTNDGVLARKLTLPSSEIPRTYVAMVGGADMSTLDAARRGMTVDGITYRPMEIDVMSSDTVRVTVREGKKNEIRIVLRACGHPVRKLHRISFGPIELGNLPVGQIRAVSQKSIDALLKSL